MQRHLFSIREIYRILLLIPVFLSLGCAKLGPMLIESNEPYHFRKTRWGYTQERVLLAESGKRLFLRKGNTLVFNHHLVNIPVKIVYTLTTSHKLIQFRLEGNR